MLTDFGAGTDASPSENAAALSEALESQSAVYVPAGTFVTDRAIVYDVGDVTLWGPGVIKASENISDYQYMLRVRGGRNVSIRGVTLDGTISNDTNRSGLRMEEVTRASLIGAEIRNWGDHDGVTDEPGGVSFVGCKGVWGLRNHIHHCGGKGMSAYARNTEPTDGVVFSGNYVHDTGEDALFAGSEENSAGSPARFIIDSNHLRDNRSQYLVRIAGDGGENITHMTNNTALRADTAAFNYKTPDVQDSSAVIANNSYNGSGRAGISIQSTGTGNLAASVVGNRITGDNGGVLFESGCRAPSLCALNITPTIQVGSDDEVARALNLAPDGSWLDTAPGGSPSGG